MDIKGKLALTLFAINFTNMDPAHRSDANVSLKGYSDAEIFRTQQPTDSISQPQIAPFFEPISSPWNLKEMPWQLASTSAANSGAIMKFYGNDNLGTVDRRVLLHHKRKSDEVIPLPSKQFITEEIITKHFNGLHISSSHIQNVNANTAHSASILQEGQILPKESGKCFTNLTYRDYQITAKELETKLRNASRITMCDEIKKFHEQQKKSPIMLESFWPNVEKPCTALVLWQPQKANINIKEPAANYTTTQVDMVDDEENIEDIEDFIDNNNTSSMDFNNIKADGMDEDL